MLLCIFIVTKPQQATDMSADNLSTAERKKKKTGKNVKYWEQCLFQGHYQPTYQKARKGFIYFITFPLIFISRVQDSDQTNI